MPSASAVLLPPQPHAHPVPSHMLLELAGQQHNGAATRNVHLKIHHVSDICCFHLYCLCIQDHHTPGCASLREFKVKTQLQSVAPQTRPQTSTTLVTC